MANGDKQSSRKSRSESDGHRRRHRKHSCDTRKSTSPSHRHSHRSSSKSHRDEKTSRSSSPHERHRSKRSASRSRSRSPLNDHKECKERDEPQVCHCLGVFGLSSYTEEKDLKEVFGQYGPIDDICIIYDRQSGHSKGYGFVYFRSTSDAMEAKKGTQGLVLDQHQIRVDYSLTLRPHSPTPGRYLGRRGNRDQDRYYNEPGDYEDWYRDDKGSYRSRDRHHHYDYCDNDPDDYNRDYHRRSRKHSPYSHVGSYHKKVQRFRSSLKMLPRGSPAF